MAERRKPRLTIITPVFNDEAVVPLFAARIGPVMQQLGDRYDTSLLFLNNASTDGSLEAIRTLRAERPNVFYISLSNNVGYQRSLECGLRNAQGDLLILIDVDCEDPPEMILDFVREHEAGFDIVYGERLDRVEWFGMKLLRKLFYRLTRTLADERFVLDMGDFLLMTSEVRDAVVEDRSSFPFLRASVGRVGFRIKGLPYKRSARAGGKTHFSLIGMTVFAVTGILSSSTLLLRLPLLMFPFWFLALLALTVLMLAGDRAWAFPVFLLVAGSFLGWTAAVIAVYVARVYKNTLGRPNYVIDRRNTIMQG